MMFPQVILANGPSSRNMRQQAAHPQQQQHVATVENGFVRQGVVQHRIHPLPAAAMPSAAASMGLGRGGVGAGAGSHDVPVRILVNAKYIGALIGQGGSNIRQISKESKARCV